MKLSWSHKLFLKINEQVGRRPWLDRFMIFCAKWLIVFVVFRFFLKVAVMFGIPDFVFFLSFLFLPPYAASYILAVVWRRKRPVKELPGVKEIVRPLGTWKSFPSDHTIAVSIIAIFSLLVGFPIVLSLFFIVTGVLVAIGRVYVGVHYPRDIIGGCVIGIGWTVILVRFLGL
ncbi:MAG: phosphatase PAP2 family protein [Patescibacteria group bacterium]